MSDENHSLTPEGILSLPDKKLKLQFVLGMNISEDKDNITWMPYLSSLLESPWVVRIYPQIAEGKKRNIMGGKNFIIVDRKSAIISVAYAYYNVEPYPYPYDDYDDYDDDYDDYGRKWIYSLTSGVELENQIGGFNSVWEQSIPFDVLYKDPDLHAIDKRFSRLVGFSSAQWSKLIKMLAEHPENIYSLSPRKFEELVAELLAREGLRVELTPETHDGGRDILAFMNTAVGEHLFLVECKRYSPDRPVDVALVRNLYGVVEAERATAGLLVTSSYFTKPAIAFQGFLKTRLSLKDYRKLVNWIRS
jgi:HJR/Mrr/RecB family endonuclease